MRPKRTGLAPGFWPAESAARFAQNEPRVLALVRPERDLARRLSLEPEHGPKMAGQEGRAGQDERPLEALPISRHRPGKLEFCFAEKFSITQNLKNIHSCAII